MERRTILAQNFQAPKVQTAPGVNPAGAFGDFSGMINLGGAVSQAGELGMHMQDRAHRRDAMDMQNELNLAILKHAAQAKADYIDQASTNPATRKYSIAESSVRDNRVNLDKDVQSITEKYSGNPYAKHILARRSVDAQWLQHNQELVLGAHADTAQAKLTERSAIFEDTARLTFGAIGDNPVAALKQATEMMTQANDRSMYPEAFADNQRKSLSRYVAGSIEASIRNRRGLTKETDSALVSAEKSGWLTPEQSATLRGMVVSQQTVNKAENNAKLKRIKDSLENGTLEMTSDEIRKATEALVAEDEPTVRANHETDLVVAKAVGSINRQGNEGRLIRPFDELVALEAALSDPTQTGPVREFMVKSIGDVIPRKAEEFSAQEVESFRQKVHSAVKAQIAQVRGNQSWRVFSNDAHVKADEGNPEYQMRTINEWYERNRIPAQYRGYVAPEKASELINTYKMGDPGKTYESIDSLINTFGHTSAFTFANTLVKDPSTKTLGGMIRMATQASFVDDAKDIKDGIIATSLKFAKADQFATKAREAKADFNDNYSRILKIVDLYKPKDGEGSMRVFTQALQHENPEAGLDMADSLRRNIANLVYHSTQGTYVDDKELASHVVEAFNDVSHAFIPVRVNGMYAQNPEYMLVTPKYVQGGFQRLVEGPQANRTKSAAETSSRYTEALDALITASHPYEKTTSGVGTIGHAIAARLADFNVSIDGHSTALHSQNKYVKTRWSVDDNGTAYADAVFSINKDELIPMQDLVVKQGNSWVPISKEPTIFNSSWDQKIRAYLSKSVVGQPGTDLTSVNGAVLRQHHGFRPNANQDFQLTLHVPGTRVGQIGGGNEYGSTDVFYRVRDKQGNLTGAIEPYVIPRSRVETIAARGAEWRWELGQRQLSMSPAVWVGAVPASSKEDINALQQTPADLSRILKKPVQKIIRREYNKPTYTNDVYFNSPDPITSTPAVEDLGVR